MNKVKGYIDSIMRVGLSKRGESEVVSEYNTLLQETSNIEDVMSVTRHRGFVKLMTVVKAKITAITDDIEAEYRSEEPSVVKTKTLIAKRDAFLEFVDIVNETIAEEPRVREKLKLLQETIRRANLDRQRQSPNEPLVDVGAF